MIWKFFVKGMLSSVLADDFIHFYLLVLIPNQHYWCVAEGYNTDLRKRGNRHVASFFREGHVASFFREGVAGEDVFTIVCLNFLTRINISKQTKSNMFF